MKSRNMLVLGIDPGSRHTGYGLVDERTHSRSYVASGRINAADAGKFEDRLAIIYDNLAEILGEHDPEVCALESLYVAQNPMSSLKLGHARGAAVLAVKKSGIPIFDYSPRRVKNTVAGHGAASKDAVQKMVKERLSLRGELSRDASDALAVALCHCFHPEGT